MILCCQIQARFYSPEIIKQKPTKQEITDRVLKVCASYDKVTADKVPKIYFFYFRDMFCHMSEVTVPNHL